MFGKKKQGGTTVLVLDIESGSVASALVQLSTTQPHVLSYRRQYLPLQQTRTGASLSSSLEQALDNLLKITAEISARMRLNAPAQNLGQINKAVIFLAAPWGMPDLNAGGPHYVPGIRQYIKEAVQAAFGDIAVSFYTSADATLYGSRALAHPVDTLTVALRGEMLELLLLNEAGASAYSTLPLGSGSILRTLQSHGALSNHEARSMLALAHHKDTIAYEPLMAAGRHLSDSFADGVQLILPAGSATSVVVLGEPYIGEWFAKSIADNPRMEELFSEESTVEALLPYHVGNLVTHGNVHDPFVLMESLFVSGNTVL